MLKIYAANVRTDDTTIFQFGLFIWINILMVIKRYLSVDIQKFNNDQRRECDCDDVCERFQEEYYSSKHDDASLIWNL